MLQNWDPASGRSNIVPKDGSRFTSVRQKNTNQRKNVTMTKKGWLSRQCDSESKCHHHVCGFPNPRGGRGDLWSKSALPAQVKERRDALLAKGQILSTMFYPLSSVTIEDHMIGFLVGGVGGLCNPSLHRSERGRKTLHRQIM